MYLKLKKMLKSILKIHQRKDQHFYLLYWIGCLKGIVNGQDFFYNIRLSWINGLDKFVYVSDSIMKCNCRKKLIYKYEFYLANDGEIVCIKCLINKGDTNNL